MRAPDSTQTDTLAPTPHSQHNRPQLQPEPPIFPLETNFSEGCAEQQSRSFLQPPLLWIQSSLARLQVGHHPLLHLSHKWLHLTIVASQHTMRLQRQKKATRRPQLGPPWKSSSETWVKRCWAGQGHMQLSCQMEKVRRRRVSNSSPAARMAWCSGSAAGPSPGPAPQTYPFCLSL